MIVTSYLFIYSAQECKFWAPYFVLYMCAIAANLIWIFMVGLYLHMLEKVGAILDLGCLSSVRRFIHSSVHHNFVSAQYLENSFLEFIQILFVHWYWQDLAWDCYKSFCPNMYQSYGPWFTPKFRFCSIFWEQIDRTLPNFIYAIILTRSSLGLLHVIFGSFVPELWPLIYARISFPLNILRSIWQNFTKFYICNYIQFDKIYLGIVTQHFSHVCTRVPYLLMRW